MRTAPTSGVSSISSSGYRDGLGHRALAFDHTSGDILERLELRPELRAFEQPLRDALGTVAELEDERFAKPRDIERGDEGRLTVVSEYIAGRRIADALDLASEFGIIGGLDAALGLLLEIVPALGRLHEAGLVHGALGPGHVTVTSGNQLVILDALYGHALERLQLAPERLWAELRIARLPEATSFDVASDIGQASMLAAAVVLGRPLQDADFPAGLDALRQEILDVASIRGTSTFARALEGFFDRTLPVDGRKPYRSADEAAIDLRKLVRREMGIDACRTALVEFFQQIDAADAERLERERIEDAQRADAERIEAERVARERAEADARERQRRDAERVARERDEAERIAREKAEAEERERQRLEVERIAREKAEAERREAERIAREKAEAEERERQRLAAERIAREKAEAEERERQRLEAERIAREKAEAERREAERIAREKAEAERIAREKAEAERREAERIAREKAEAERIAREKAEAERREAERIAREKAEAARREAERLEAERKERERLEAERAAKEKAEAERRERERLEAERRERARLEAERIAREKAEAEKRETERIAREKAEAAKRELERLEAERRERERLEAERIARDKAEVEARERQRRDAERAARENEAAERGAREKEVAERAAREKQDTEHKAREQAEAERIAREQAEGEVRERQRRDAERAAREKEETERAARAQAEAERIAREKAEAERRERERLEAERVAREQAEAEARARQRRDAERAAREKEETERVARAQADAERIAREKTEAERRERDLAAQSSSSWLVPPDRAAAFDRPGADIPPAPPAAAPTRSYPVYVPPPEPEPAAWSSAPVDVADVGADITPIPAPYVPPAARPAPPAIRLKFDGEPATAREPTVADAPDESRVEDVRYPTFGEQTSERKIPWKLAAAAAIVLAAGLAAFRLYSPVQAPLLAKPAEAKPAPVAHTAPAASPAGGQLQITTDPAGAKILLDGKPVGDSPVTLDGISAGRHVVTLMGDGGAVKRTVRIEAGKSVTLDVPIFSGFTVISAPFIVSVSEAGRLIGTSDNQLMLAPGHHQLHLSNKDLNYETTQSVDVEPGEVARVSLDPRGEANINAQPWAEVWIDGEKVGETPLANLPVRLGVREIVFKNPQLGERKLTVTITAGTAAAISVDFNK